MIKGFQNTFSDRLKRLYTDAGYDVDSRGWAGRVAADMFKRGIIQYSTPADLRTDADMAKQRGFIAHTLKQHLSVDDASGISGLWLSRYCQFFGCSAAFLFGEIPLPTPEETDVCRVTGLSPDAVHALIENRWTAAIDKKLFRENVMHQDPVPAANYNLIPDTISFLLRPDYQELLKLIGNYLISDDFVLSADLPAVLKTENYNGSGLQFDTMDLLRNAIPNQVVALLHQYRLERLKNRK